MAEPLAPPTGFCRELALDQPLIGSAPEGSRWVLVEDNGRWGAKLPRETDLPEPVKHWLRALERADTRIHLIRRPARASPGARGVGRRHYPTADRRAIVLTDERAMTVCCGTIRRRF